MIILNLFQRSGLVLVVIKLERDFGKYSIKGVIKNDQMRLASSEVVHTSDTFDSLKSLPFRSLSFYERAFFGEI